MENTSVDEWMIAFINRSVFVYKDETVNFYNNTTIFYN